MPRISLLSLLVLLALQVKAQDVCPKSPSSPSANSTEGWYFNPQAPLTLSAERQQWTEPGHSLLQGSVKVIQGDNQVTAEQVEFDNQGQWQAEGGVQFNNSLGILQAERMQGNTANHELQMQQMAYQFFNPYRQGNAAELHLQQQGMKLQQATYTSCQGQQPDWLIQADTIRLNRDKGWGEADNIVVRIHNVPVFYSPYLSFPIDSRRRSGLLFPNLGYSAEDGIDYAQPYYLNLAPDYDATITPRFIQNRGLQLQTELRYLQDQGEGQLNLEYLAHDRKAIRDSEQNRSLLDWQQKNHFGQNWLSELRYSEVSDNNYLHDLGSSTLATDMPLQRIASLTYQQDSWSANTSIQDYQVLDSPSIPYQIMPRIGIEGDFIQTQGQLPIRYGFDSELVRFRHPTATNAERLDMSAYISLPFEYAAGYIHPKVELHHTSYNQSDPILGQNGSQLDKQNNRTLPLYQLDAGLWFDRKLRLWNRNYNQSLEPQINYLYIPYRNQNDIGLYDTTSISSGFDSLTRENRFIGRDRIGDNNRLSLILATRILREDNGTERLRARIGRSLYFADRKVQLQNNQAIDTREQSPLISELGIRLSDDGWLDSEWLYDDQQHRTSQVGSQLSYQPQAQESYVLGYRYRLLDNNDYIEQSHVGANYPLNERWGVSGFWQQDLQTHHSTDLIWGLSYSSCCWVIKTLWRRHLEVRPDDLANNQSNPDYKSGVYVQFELKGLSTVGNSQLSTLLRDRLQPDSY